MRGECNTPFNDSIASSSFSSQSTEQTHASKRHHNNSGMVMHSFQIYTQANLISMSTMAPLIFLPLLTRQLPTKIQSDHLPRQILLLLLIVIIISLPHYPTHHHHHQLPPLPHCAPFPFRHCFRKKTKTNKRCGGHVWPHISAPV